VATLSKDDAVYGGPYLDESTAILTEARKDEPDFEKLVSDWDTISNGALRLIDTVQNPKPKPVGPFVENFKDDSTLVFIEPPVSLDNLEEDEDDEYDEDDFDDFVDEDEDTL
jgi:hypothetical protein